jgi:hypothetical protein
VLLAPIHTYLTRLARLGPEQVDTMYQRLIQQVPGCEARDGKKSHASVLSLAFPRGGSSSSRRADLLFDAACS